MCGLVGAQVLEEMFIQRCQNMPSCQYVEQLTDVKRVRLPTCHRVYDGISVRYIVRLNQ